MVLQKHGIVVVQNYVGYLPIEIKEDIVFAEIGNDDQFFLATMNIGDDIGITMVEEFKFSFIHDAVDCRIASFPNRVLIEIQNRPGIPHLVENVDPLQIIHVDLIDASFG